MKVCLWCMPCMEDRQCTLQVETWIIPSPPLEVCTGWMPEWQDGRMAGRIQQDGTMALKRMALHLSFKMFMSSVMQWYTTFYLQCGRASTTIIY